MTNFARAAACIVLVAICPVVLVSDIYDVSPPKIQLLGDAEKITVYIGEGIAYREYLDVSDNVSPREQISVMIDTSRIDIYRQGIYLARVIATDRRNNTSIKDIKIQVVLPQATDRQLFLKIEQTTRQIITSNMSTEEKCRRIYTYIRETIAYCEQNEPMDCNGAAYYGLVNLRGDCFTYACVARAFFEYLNIECITVQRQEGKTRDTHFWNMVNIGTAQNPEWYHFDCTRLLPDLNMMGCLMTDDQLELYNEFRAGYTENEQDKYFYLYDKDKYPTVSNKEITRISY